MEKENLNVCGGSQEQSKLDVLIIDNANNIAASLQKDRILGSSIPGL